MAYGYLTWTQLQTELQNRLSEVNGLWNDNGAVPEIQLYLTEALRTWNAFTNYYRTRVTLPVGSSVFYDVSLVKDAVTNQFVRAYTVKDTDLCNAITYHLQEPLFPAGGPWAGTDQFTAADVQAALQRRRNQFLLESGCLLTHLAVAVAANPTLGRVTLVDTLEKIVRAAWQDTVTGAWTPLGLDDEQAFQYFSNAWNQAGAPDPLAISISASPLLTVQLAPAPTNAGNLDLVAIFSGADLNLPVGVVLGIPDDFTWVVKWGALADLLGKEGQAKDPARATYCEQRWREGIELARLSTAVMLDSLPAYFGAQNLNVEMIENLDHYFPGWQGKPAATPTAIALMGLNLLAVCPPLQPPGPYYVSVDTNGVHYLMGIQADGKMTATVTTLPANPLILTDPGGQNWILSLNAQGQLLQTATSTPGVTSVVLIDPVSSIYFRLSLNAGSQLQSVHAYVVTDSNSIHWQFGIQADGKLTVTQTTDPLDPVVLVDPHGQAWNFTLDATGHLVQTATGAPGVASIILIDPVQHIGFALSLTVASQLQSAGTAPNLSFDVVQNAPIPVNPGDLVQIGREDLDALIDYAFHLACFKIGAQQIQDTVEHYTRFKRVAALHNEKLRDSTIFWEQPDDNARAKEKPRDADAVLTQG